MTVGCRTFQHAVWNTQHVTLVINTGAVPSSTVALGTYSLSAITEFSDLIPAKFACVDSDDNKYIQGIKFRDVNAIPNYSIFLATVGVLPWLQISTIQSYSDTLKLKGSQTHEETWKDASFIMLQLVNALKILQAQGIEELALSLNSFILCKEMDKESHVRLCVLQG